MMHRKAHPLFLTCETPVHAGSGSELGIVDLPIQREKHTTFPKFEASTLKGSLREAVERAVGTQTFKTWGDKDTKVQRVFGYDDGSLSNVQKDALQQCFTFGDDGKVRSEFAGCIGFADARLLLFPVKSMKGVFAWITCPKVLQQFARDMALAEVSDIPEMPEEANLVSTKSTLLLSGNDAKNTHVVLEEYAFEVSKDEQTSKVCRWLAGQVFQHGDVFSKTKASTDVVILGNDDFRDFVNLSTEVITRTKIDNNTGTVEQGALFTEEYLPAEAIMYSLVLTAPEFTENKAGLKEEEVLSFFIDQLPPVVQLGGNATLGKGIIRTKLLTNPIATKGTTND